MIMTEIDAKIAELREALDHADRCESVGLMVKSNALRSVLNEIDKLRERVATLEAEIAELRATK